MPTTLSSLKKNPTPIRLVILLQDLEFGGTQRYVINLLRDMNRNIFSPELWLLRGGDDLLSEVQRTGVKLVYMSHSKHTVWPSSILRLLKHLLVNPPKILYTLTVVPNIWGRILGKITPVATIISGYRNLLPKQHEEWLWPLSDLIICNAEALKKSMVSKKSIPTGRIKVIPNGVDPDIFWPDSSQKSSFPSILFAGRLVVEKGLPTLIDSFGVILAKLPQAELTIVGNGPFEKTIKAKIVAESLTNIKCYSGSGEINPFFRRAWVFAIASISEGSPNVILEAMAAGLPIIATRVGGIPELVEDGKTGFLVDPGDSAAFAAAVIKLLQDKSLRQKMGLEARKKIRCNYTSKKMVQETENAILEVYSGGCAGNYDV